MEIFSVSELNLSIKTKLEAGFAFVKVQGEISNLKEQSSGHLYFTLKDAQSQLSCVLFRGYAKELKRPLKNGDQLILEGEISVYAPRGVYQLITRKVEFTGVGELLLRLHALKSKLEDLGWFAKEKKKKIPLYPKTIGVVTSPTGAVIQDILHILDRRLEKYRLILYPVKVQGEGAAFEVAEGIRFFNEHNLADVLIVGRGGGSLEDLFAFNEEVVAAALYESKIPTISAVGHETDFSISDFVADLRAPTPSAAAEIVSAERGKQVQFLAQAKQRLNASLVNLLSQSKKQLEQLKRNPLFSRPLTLLEPHYQRIDDLTSSFDQVMSHAIKERSWKLSALKKQALALRPEAQILIRKEKLHRLASHLQSIRPDNLLQKGYCILFEENSPSVILSTKTLQEEKRYRLKLGDGHALVAVQKVSPHAI